MRTLFVYNHPYDGSFCNALLCAALNGVGRSGAEPDIINLDKDDFNPVMSSNDLKAFVTARKEPGKALMMLDKKVIDYKVRLEKANHLVFIFPVWWMLMPALTKGFIDKVIFPSVAYEYGPKGQMQSRLWNLRRVTVITTMGGSAQVYDTLVGNAVWRALSYGTFEAIGVEHCKWLNFDNVSSVTPEIRCEWLQQVEDYFALL